MAREPQAHSYTPRGVLREVFSCRRDELLVAGPAGTGKSMACLEKMLALALLNPGMRGLIVRKTLVSLGSTALVTWRERVAKEALASGIVRWFGGSQAEPAQYQFRNKSVIVVGGMDKAIKIMSSEYDVAYAQEATELTEEDWEMITTRLRNGRISFQQLMADCNPGPPYHWLKQRVARGLTTMLESRHEDNPVLFDLLPDGGHAVTEQGAAYIGKLDRLTGVRYQRLRRGIWAAAEGLVFEEFDPAVHLVDREDVFPDGVVPWEWPRFWSVDFGYVHPFVCQFWTEDPDGRLIMYREIYMTKRTVDQHARTMIEAVSVPDPDLEALPPGSRPHPAVAHHGRIWIEPKPEFVVCDHDAENRAVLDRELGFSTRPAHKTVTDGIEAVQKRLRVTDDGGRPRVLLCRDAVVELDGEQADAKKPTSTADEIIGYIWDTGGGKKPKEAPLKQDDDGCDAMRYVVAQRDLAASFGYRSLE